MQSSLPHNALWPQTAIIIQKKVLYFSFMKKWKNKDHTMISCRHLGHVYCDECSVVAFFLQSGTFCWIYTLKTCWEFESETPWKIRGFKSHHRHALVIIPFHRKTKTWSCHGYDMAACSLPWLAWVAIVHGIIIEL